ncbi:MAG TPA: AcvB/VirJ family lysyl-phosphatidylglycerol hydrolase [Steroidobacter sp.]|uniref:virulence factor family protein n=1 Tax=Steroidobacter sp. TaxID=1978227 RepID=UPI002ED86B5C
MRVYRWCLLLFIVALAPNAPAETISHGRFDKIEMYRPQGEVRQTALFFSGERGWTKELETIAQSLVRQGVLVAGIDSHAFFRKLEQDEGDCVFPSGDLENLSHFLQAYYRLPAYRPALLIGESSGAEFVHAMLAQAPAGTFGGGISLGVRPKRALKKPLCPADESASSAQPEALWLALKGDGDFQTWEPQFASAFQRLAASTHAPPAVSAAELEDLPIVEVSSQGKGDTLAVLISGDGGWAGIDKELAAALAKQGMPVVGLDSLRYFWTKRTPESTAADVDRLVRHYLAAWKKRSVLLIGFSQGADVMPFVVNRLPASTRERLRTVALLSLSQTAVFEFHLQNWLGAEQDAKPVAPELLRMKGVRALCVYGEDETESLCAMPAAKSLQVLKLSGGHHFDGDYPKLASLLLSHMH